MGIVEECKGQNPDWDNPNAWRTLIDEIVPILEAPLVFGIQYFTSTIGPGSMKMVNSLRCMLNSWTTNSWMFYAGIWQILLYAEVTQDFVADWNEAYQYVCTCLVDARGLKSMLGATEQSSSIFSSCSESGSN